MDTSILRDKECILPNPYRTSGYRLGKKEALGNPLDSNNLKELR
jgi:hypothetical protein